ncbi:hypothetical protein MMC17_004472 [Xylographa soralifera]|nr:hypothetical protein [Xylographa soralifera]
MKNGATESVISFAKSILFQEPYLFQQGTTRPQLYDDVQKQGYCSDCVPSRSQEKKYRNSSLANSESWPNDEHVNTSASPSDTYHEISRFNRKKELNSYRERELMLCLTPDPEDNHPPRRSIHNRESNFIGLGVALLAAEEQTPSDDAESQASVIARTQVNSPDNDSGWRSVKSEWRSVNGRLIKRKGAEMIEVAACFLLAVIADRDLNGAQYGHSRGCIRREEDRYKCEATAQV